MAETKFPLKNKRTTLERGEKFISNIYFSDCNLYSKLITDRKPLKKFEHFKPEPPGRITFDEAIKGKYKPTSVGSSFGPTWSTHWFKIEIDIPNNWVGEYVVLEWDSNSEAMVWKDGAPLQGFSTMSRRNTFLLSNSVTENELRHSYYIEMACNEMQGAGDGTEISPPDNNRYFTVSKANIAILNRPAMDLYHDIEVLHSFAELMSEENPRSWEALYTMNKIINTVNIERNESIKQCHKIAQDYFSVANGGGQLILHAISNCHIDTAWLWPYAETIRKCARSFSSTIKLLEVYPKLTFACSQAQQFAWVKEYYPTLYADMKKHIAAGRFIPVGGTWVEMDGLVPNGESFIRQFLYGQRFFKQEFGKYCSEFWLPDTFGYSAQFPQIMEHCGIKRFMTQKLSWSLVNKFPHHTFWWTGIDGTKVLTHFPPGECYSMRGKYKEVNFSSTNFLDKGRSNDALFLFGTGDGGQGATAAMIERLNRMENCDGCPIVKMSTPDNFFTKIEADSERLCEWVGELYLELHNGTYTTQAKTKQGNRHSEIMIQELESLCCIVSLRNSSYFYPMEEIIRLWKLLLINQFHDVLPGTSINIVYEDSDNYYKEIADGVKEMKDKAFSELFQTKEQKQVAVLNLCSWKRREIVAIANSNKCYNDISHGQLDNNAAKLVFCEVPSFGVCTLPQSMPNIEPVKLETVDGFITLKNNYFTVVLDSACRIVLLKHVNDNSTSGIIEALKPGSKKGNQFVVYDDIPLYWDAWDVMDYHLETRKAVDIVESEAEIIEAGPLRASVQTSLKLSDQSSIQLTAIVDAECPFVRFDTKVIWNEAHKFLKVEFPANALTTEVTYEIQYGHLKRNTHFNTSWDWAKYEVCGHKWADISEYNRGMAVLNDSKYGWSCLNNILCLSLLRSSKAPDPSADMGEHSFTYAVMPHVGTFQEANVIQSAYNLNRPLSITTTSEAVTTQSFITVDNPAVVVEAFKKSEDQNDVYVLRLYESFGGSTTAEVELNLPLYNVRLCNGLEEALEDQSNFIFVESVEGNGNGNQLKFSLNFKPFQIQSLLLYI